jgi:hypothetical protein
MNPPFSKEAYDATQAKRAIEQYQFYPDVSDWAAIFKMQENIASTHFSKTKSEGISSATPKSPLAHSGDKSPNIFKVQLKGAFNVIDERANALAKELAAKMVGKRWLGGQLVDNPDPRWALTDLARNWLKEKIAIAFDEGWTPTRLASALYESGIFSKPSAKVIAATEIGFAHARAHKNSALAMGANMKRTSLSADHQVDDICSLAAAAGEVPIDYDYGMGLTFPLFHPACRCAISFYVRK